MSSHAGRALDSLLWLAGCTHLFIDGGSNLGGGVDDFFKGSFYRCAMNSPTRLYAKAWYNASRQTKTSWMGPLGDSKTSWCVRSFEANPRLQPMLKEREREHRSKGRDVRFIDGVLGTESGPAVPRTIVTYSKDPAGSGASRFDFKKVHSGRPPLISSEVYRGAGYDVREVVRRMLQINPTARVALRLDVEGDELFIHRALLEAAAADRAGDGSLLCQVDWMCAAEPRARGAQIPHHRDPTALCGALRMWCVRRSNQARRGACGRFTEHHNLHVRRRRHARCPCSGARSVH